MMAGQYNYQNDAVHNCNIHNGITFRYLHHAKAKRVAHRFTYYMERIRAHIWSHVEHARTSDYGMSTKLFMAVNGLSVDFPPEEAITIISSG